MNTAALGFVGTPRGAFQRDSYFTGSSGNPSKKGSMVAPARPNTQQTKRIDPIIAIDKRNDDRSRDTTNATSNDNPLPQLNMNTVPQSNNLSMMERRCAFLELQAKRHTTAMSDQHELITQLKEQINNQTEPFGWVNAQVNEDTTEYNMTEYAPECTLTLENDNKVTSGTTVNISYPMREVDHNGNKYIVMIRRKIDPVTGQFSMSWIVVYSIINNVETRHASNFTLT